MKKSNLERAFESVLLALGVDETDENFVETPARMARLFQDELCRGMHPGADNEAKALLSKTFPTESTDMVAVLGHVCFGLCPHHMLPVQYEAHIGYIPNGRAVGLSKLPRLLDITIAKPSLQEDLGHEVIKQINSHLSQDAIVVLNGYHSCMSIRGVKSPNACTITAALSGQFNQPDVKAEFYQMIEMSRGRR